MRAVIYCRVSTQQQTKNLSLPAQRKECVKFCKAQGWTVDRVFVERGESAKSADRTVLTRLLRYCRDLGRVHVTVVYRSTVSRGTATTTTWCGHSLRASE